MERTILSLGSNLGASESILQEAIATLNTHGERMETSEIYSTEPWGNTNQPAFINCAVSIWVSYTPSQLLKVIQGIEDQFGRERKEHWGARSIDIDIILYGKRIINIPDLVIPHPHFNERNFVLIPMKDLHIKTPFREFELKKSIDQMMNESNDKSGVIKLVKEVK